jgi:ankyrin repeat protein
MWDCNHTALHMTIENGDIALARMLLDAGADPNIRDDKYNATALGWADFFGRADFADLVREKGVDTNKVFRGPSPAFRLTRGEAAESSERDTQR